MRTIADQYVGKPFANRERWEDAFHTTVARTVEVHLLSRLEPTLVPMEATLAEIDSGIAEIVNIVNTYRTGEPRT